MSFIIHKKYPFEQTATQPITVFKTVSPPKHVRDAWIAHFEELDKVWYSEVMEFRYREGVTFTTDLWGAKHFGRYCSPGQIDYGFSSYDNSIAAFTSRDIDNDLVIAEFEIPVGSKYYYNPDNHMYISDTIKCIGYYPMWKGIVDSFLYPISSFYKLVKHFNL